MLRTLTINREVIAGKIIKFEHIPKKFNPTDILSKHWGYQKVKDVLKTLLLYSRDTQKLFNEEKDSQN